MAANNNRKGSKGWTARDYEVLVALVMNLPKKLRQPVADSFAKQLAERFQGFDPSFWRARTGGEIARAKTETEDERAARVKAYVARTLGRVV